MAPVLYMTPLSPPSRAVLITAKSIQLNLELKNIDLKAGEHRSNEFLKINPLHAVPVLVDGELILTDSHAINAYLIRKYAKNDDLYPKELIPQILVDQKLHFDTGIMFNLFRTTAMPIFYRKSKIVSNEQINRVLEGYGFVEKFLENNVWLAGDYLTIADFSLFTTITSLDVFVGLDSGQFPKITAWIDRIKKLEFTRINDEGLEELKKVVALLTN